MEEDQIVRAPISIPFSISTSTTGLVYSPTMPKKDPEYHLTSYHPVQLVYLMLPGGGRKPFEVYQDLQLDKEIIQCDKCDKFLQLPKNRNIKILDNHHDSAVCGRSAARRERRRVEEDETIRANAALQTFSNRQSRHGHSLSVGMYI